MSSPDSCPVVRIECQKGGGNPHGFREINATDYDAKVHKLFEGEVDVAAAPAGNASPPAEEPKPVVVATVPVSDAPAPAPAPTVAADSWGAPKA